LEEQRILRLLAPHIVRIMHFADLLEMRAITADRLIGALDALSTGAWAGWGPALARTPGPG
jgi:hypothetical protein